MDYGSDNFLGQASNVLSNGNPTVFINIDTWHLSYTTTFVAFHNGYSHYVKKTGLTTLVTCYRKQILISEF